MLYFISFIYFLPYSSFFSCLPNWA